MGRVRKRERERERGEEGWRSDKKPEKGVSR